MGFGMILSRTVRMGPAAMTALALALLLGGPSPASAQTLEAELRDTANRYTEDQTRGLSLIAPRHMERAADRLGRAQAEHRRGGRIEDIRKSLREAAEALGGAEALQEIGEVLMRGALAARADALTANAPQFATAEWSVAEKKVREAGRKIEDGNENDARRRAAEAETLYREAELQAVRNSVLGEARRLREAAMETRADGYAPETLAEADALLGRADASLELDPGQPSGAGQLAGGAADGYRHATWIAALADSVRRREVATETVIRRYEEELAEIAGLFRLEPSFAEGSRPAAAQVEAAIRSLQEDRRRLEAALADREVQIRGLQASSDSLEASLARLEEREATISAELRKRERGEETLREVRALFNPQEAEILIGLDRITIRLLGLTFDSGSDKIRPEDYSLLTKLQQAIRAFPEAEIVVEGHTDSQGNDEFNRALSLRRAIAVREYTLANMAMSADRIRSIGYGESRPIATNDTAEGRARNRRIDVVLELSPE